MLGGAVIAFGGGAATVPDTLKGAGEGGEARLARIFWGDEGQILAGGAGAVGGPETAGFKAGDGGPVDEVDGLAPLAGGGGAAGVVKPELPVAGGGGSGLGWAVLRNEADAPAAFNLKKTPGQAYADEENKSADEDTANPWGAGGEALGAVEELVQPGTDLFQ